jgi:hypothetical protein
VGPHANAPTFRPRVPVSDSCRGSALASDKVILRTVGVQAHLACGYHITPCISYVRCWMTLSTCLTAEEIAIALGGNVLSAACGCEPFQLATKEDLRRLLVKLAGQTYEGWERSAQLWLADDRTGTGMHLVGLGYPEVPI